MVPLSTTSTDAALHANVCTQNSQRVPTWCEQHLRHNLQLAVYTVQENKQAIQYIQVPIWIVIYSETGLLKIYGNQVVSNRPGEPCTLAPKDRKQQVYKGTMAAVHKTCCTIAAQFRHLRWVKYELDIPYSVDVTNLQCKYFLMFYMFYLWTFSNHWLYSWNM